MEQGKHEGKTEGRRKQNKKKKSLSQEYCAKQQRNCSYNVTILVQIEIKTGLNMQWREKQHFVHAAVFVIVSVCIKMSAQLKQIKKHYFYTIFFHLIAGHA